MSGSYSVSLRFRERERRADWDTRKLEIANYIAGCIYYSSVHSCIETLYWNAQAFAAGSKIADNFLDDHQISLDELKKLGTDTVKYFEIVCSEAYGNDSCIANNILGGLTEKYPDIDFEFHLGDECDGDVSDDVTICVDGRLYGGSYYHVYDPWVFENPELIKELNQPWLDEGKEPPYTTEEAYYAQEIFQRPEPTEENPYPIPRAYPSNSCFASPEEWFCDLFQKE